MDGCSPVNLLHILRTPLPMNTSGGLLPKIFGQSIKIKKTYIENLNITFSVTLVRYYQSFLKGTEYVSTQTSDFLHISLFSKAQILCGLAETHQNSREIVQEL